MKNRNKIVNKILGILIVVMASGFIGCIDSEDPISNQTTPIPTTEKTVVETPKTTVTKKTIESSTMKENVPVNIPKLQLEDYDGGFFSMKKPVGWEVITAGSCNILGILIRDKKDPQNQIFIFTKVGPVYLSERAKSETIRYVQMGGYIPGWYEMPVVNPFTPENLLLNEHLVTSTQASKQYMQQAPILQNIKIISSEDTGTPIGGSAKIIRALFKQNDILSEGMFHIITPTPNYQLMIDPMLEIEYAYLFTGISADKDNFRFIQDELIQSLQSLIISNGYLQTCIGIIEEDTRTILKNAKTYSEISDIYMKAWEDRNKADDIMSEKTSDAIMGRDRIYDTNTGLVYEVDPEFYDNYDMNRGKYNMNNLQRLPNDNHELWTSVLLNARNIN